MVNPKSFFENWNIWTILIYLISYFRRENSKSDNFSAKNSEIQIVFFAKKKKLDFWREN